MILSKSCIINDKFSQGYIKCLNELSRENESICTLLERFLKERDYFRAKLQGMQLNLCSLCEKFSNEKEAWRLEREGLGEKIVDLESLLQKLSLCKYETDRWSKDGWTFEDGETDLLCNRVNSSLEPESLKDTLETPTLYDCTPIPL